MAGELPEEALEDLFAAELAAGDIDAAQGAGQMPGGFFGEGEQEPPDLEELDDVEDVPGGEQEGEDEDEEDDDGEEEVAVGPTLPLPAILTLTTPSFCSGSARPHMAERPGPILGRGSTTR